MYFIIHLKHLYEQHENRKNKIYLPSNFQRYDLVSNKPRATANEKNMFYHMGKCLKSLIPKRYKSSISSLLALRFVNTNNYYNNEIEPRYKEWIF